MGKSVRAVQREVDSREFTEWRAFDTIHPLPGQRMDYNAAMIAATFANVMSAKRTMFTPSDFMLDFGEKPRPTAAEIEKKALVIARRINAAKEKEDGRDSRKTDRNADSPDG